LHDFLYLLVARLKVFLFFLLHHSVIFTSFFCEPTISLKVVVRDLKAYTRAGHDDYTRAHGRGSFQRRSQALQDPCTYHCPGANKE
jgi:hypothetical protein